MRVLLVEDDATLRAQLRTGLQEAGYAVDEADNGRDAHHLGAHEAFDAVILDLGLPVLDGISVLKRWRGRRADAAGADPDGARQLARESGRHRCGC
jgi:two-component system OmpR family response regulator